MATPGKPRTLEHKDKFGFEIDGVRFALFETCTGLKKESEDIEHEEGDITIKEPGKTKYDDITLVRGAGLDEELWDWSVECLGSPSTPPRPVEEIKRPAELVQYGRAGEEIRRWTVFGTYMKSFQAGEWDKKASEAVVHEIVLRHDGFDKAEE